MKNLMDIMLISALVALLWADNDVDELCSVGFNKLRC